MDESDYFKINAIRLLIFLNIIKSLVLLLL